MIAEGSELSRAAGEHSTDENELFLKKTVLEREKVFFNLKMI
jgi:hypothetical protein